MASFADAVFVACEIELARDHFPPMMPRYPLNFDNMMYFVEIFSINDSKIHIFVPPCNIVYLIEPRKAYKPFKNVCVRAHLMS